MKKGRSLTLISLVLVLLLFASSFIVCKGILEDVIYRQIDSWLPNQPVIYTSQLTDEQQSEFVAALQEYSDTHSFMVVSKNSESQQSGVRLYTFGVFVSPRTDNLSLDPLTILGTPLVDETLIQKVASAAPDHYAGYGNNTFNRIAPMPSIRAGVDFRVEQLQAGSTFGKTCKVIGLTSSEFQELLSTIESATGVSRETLTSQTSGSVSEPGLLYMYSAGAFAILSLVFCLLMVTRALLSLKTLGVYLMLGWSKRDFFFKLFSAQVLQLFCIIPASILGAFLILNGFVLTSDIIVFGFVAMLPVIVTVSISLGIAMLAFITTRPVDAIANRYSRRGFYALAGAAYLICLCAIFAGCIYMDGPMEMYTDLAKTSTAWSEHAEWQVLNNFRVNGEHSTSDAMKTFGKSTYEWYAVHEHDDGVFLAHTSYYKADTIQALMPGSSQPEPFWYLAASPSYLKQIGIELSDEDLAQAERGTRVYLLPKALSDKQADTMQQFLRKNSKPFDSNIVTPFMGHQSYGFSTYDGSKKLFTWSADAEQPSYADGFVIAVITANNMIPFESESLVADGLGNSYIKLNKQAASTLLDDDGDAQLSDTVGVAHFTSIKNYIDGIQKSLRELVALFSVVLLIMVITLAVMIVCLITIVNRVNARTLSVKYVLGFGTWERYSSEIIFVNLSVLVGVAISILARCNAGILVGCALLIIANAVISIIVRRNSARMVLETVTEE